MPKIALSYRRDDTAAIAGRIFDRLSGRFGRDSVFMDIDSIPFGADFVAHVEGVLKDTDLLVAIIGPNWVGRRPQGTPRIADEGDFVRREIQAAIANDVKIVPVLVEGASMPAEADLPESLRSIVRRNAIAIDSGRDFSDNLGRLIELAEFIDLRRAQMLSVLEPEAPLVRPSGKDAATASARGNERAVRDYVYLSAGKVALIHAQLPKSADEGEYDASEEYKRRPFNPSRRLLQMTESVIEHIRTSEPLGTFDRPERYIADVLPLRFGVVWDYAAGIAFFGQRFEGNRYLALIGSAQSMIGSAPSRVVSDHAGYYYTLKFLNARALRGDKVSHGAHNASAGYHTFLEAAQIALHKVPPFTRNFEFVAQLIHEQDDLVLATPIYVASC